MTAPTITVARSMLLDALQRAVLLAGRARLPIAGGVLIEGSDESLTFTATDFDQTISTAIPAEIYGGAVRFCVPAKALLAIVAQLPAVPVRLEPIGRGKSTVVRIAAGRAAFQVPGLNPDEFPARAASPSARSFELETAMLIPALNRAAPHAHDQGTAVLQGVCLTCSASGVDVGATDRHAVYRERISATVVERGEWIIPNTTVAAVVRLFAKSERVTIIVDATSIAFADGSTSLVSRLIEGPFPNLEAAYASEKRKETFSVLIDREALAAAVRRTSTLPGKMRYARLTPGGGEVVVTALDQDGGTAEDALPCATTGKPFAACFNPSLLLAVLESLTSAEVRIGFGTDTSAAILTDPACADGFTGALLMPIRDRLVQPDSKGAAA